MWPRERERERERDWKGLCAKVASSIVRFGNWYFCATGQRIPWHGSARFSNWREEGKSSSAKKSNSNRMCLSLLLSGNNQNLCSVLMSLGLWLNIQ